MKRCGVVTSNSTDMIKAKSWDKEMKFALVNEFVECSSEQNAIDRNASGRGGDQKRNRNKSREGDIESNLGVEKLKSTKTRGAGGGGRGKDSFHAR
jgi:hypothetical protein